MFAHKLALAMGIPSVDAMLASMSAEQFAEWRAYANIEPWGFGLLWDYLATILATMINVSGRASRQHKSAEFLPHKQEPVETVNTPAEMWSRLRSWAAPRKKR